MPGADDGAGGGGGLDGVGADAVVIDGDGALTDETPGLAVARGEAGLDEQVDEVDSAQVVDSHGGDVVGGFLALDDALEVGGGGGGGLRAVEGGDDLGGEPLLRLHGVHIGAGELRVGEVGEKLGVDGCTSSSGTDIVLPYISSGGSVTPM